MCTRDRFRFIFHPRPPGWRERLERGEGVLFWLLATIGASAFWFALVFLMTLEP